MDEAIAELARPQHPLRLERLAAKALAAGDFAASLKYADRRCRTDPAAPAHCFVLRAEAYWRLGHREAALADLESALDIAPHDIGANRRMLAWAADHRRRNAADDLIAHDTNAANLRAAMAVLRESGEQSWAAVSIFDTEVTGWMAWVGDAPIEARLAGDEGSLTSILETDPFHPLTTSTIQATAFQLRRPASQSAQTLTLARGGHVFRTCRLRPNISPPADRRAPRPVNTVQRPTAPPTVIVPVYGDADATIACLDTLCRAAASGPRGPASTSTATSSGRPFEILVIDDASPEPGLKGHLQALAALQEIDLLVNPINLGFIGAVNRALAEVAEGDVVLVNSDTLVAPGFVDRLAAAAYAAPDIGTATPLSNNGEFFSFPKPNAVNAMPDDDAILVLDRTAARANADTIVELPSGIGFCLYIKRECLDRIGGLSETFERGYLEDVDFCLRARAAGYRNVCAPNVYVGHHGSRSFQKSKRALVLRNLDVLERRFPGYRNECRAIEAVDPLQPARAALEEALPGNQLATVLIAAGRGASLAIAEARARQLGADGQRAVLLVPQHHQFRLSAADGGIPQSLTLRFDSPSAVAEAQAELARLQATHLELIDPAAPPVLAEIAHQLGLRSDRWVTAGDILTTDGRTDQRLLAPTETALAFARGRFGRSGKSVELNSWPTEPLALAPAVDGRPQALIVIPASASAQAWQAIRTLARHLRAIDTAIPIVVAGATFADSRLMSFPNIFVTGPVTLEQLQEVMTPHNPGWILTDFETPLFGHPVLESARQAARPVAYRDWSDGAVEPRRGDLAIPAAADDEALAIAIAGWVAGS